MSPNDRGLATAQRQAERDKDRALVRLAETVGRLDDLDRRRQLVLRQASDLNRPETPLGLRGLLAGVGGRHLTALVGERAALTREHETRRRQYDDAAVRVKALERVTERRRQAAAIEERRRRDREWQDLVAARAWNEVER